jgi:hypothetical protein
MKGTAGFVGALVGPARSGTTWAGAIVDSSPEVVYRFEPFHRMSPVDPEFRIWFDKLKNQQVTDADVPRLYEMLIPAHALTNKEPFFPAKSYRLRTLGRRHLWPLARVLPMANRVYGATYSPRKGPPIVFKEVTFIKPLRNLLERTSIPVVYLVRHPCPTVMSEFRRQSEGKSKQRQDRLRELLREHAPSLADQFEHVVRGSDMVSRIALLWRCEVETCINLVRKSKLGLIMTYEQLAEDAHAKAPEIFAHFGLEFGEQTKWFLDTLYELRVDHTKGPRRTGWGKKYFSVYRNPRDEKDSWKQKVSSEDVRKIEEIVRDSPAIEFCAAAARWW